MTFPQILLLFIAAVIGGTMNAVAGGGTFFTVPTLIFTGVAPVTSNATSTIALWPGSIASIGAYRRELAEQRRGILLLLVGTSLIGGILGAILLLHTSQNTFVHLLPYLLLLATVLFAASPYITAVLHGRSAATVTITDPSMVVGNDPSPANSHTIAPLPIHNIEKAKLSVPAAIGMSFAQLVIAIYGGYFGGGIGILMLATLSMMGMENIHMMNAVKTLLTACINGVAVIAFIIAGIVVWPQAIVMIVGTILGGYGGAYYARKIDQKWVRLFVIVVGLIMTVYFFVRR